jgi:hypothetical protein
MSTLNMKIYFSKLLAVSAFFAIVTTARAQQNNTLYFLNGVPQSQEMNPATPLKCGFYIGLPVISSMEFNIGNNALSFSDVLPFKDDSLRTFLYSEETQNNFLDKLKNDGIIFANSRIDLFSLGFKTGKNFLSFKIAERLDADVRIPYGLADFFINGNISSIDQNAPAKTFDLSSLGGNLNYYHEISVGISHEFSSKLVIAIRPKMLVGIANVNTKSSKMYLKETSRDQWTVENHIKVNTSVPFLKVGNGQTGQTYSIDSIDRDSDIETSEIISNLTSMKNMGWAADFGAYYRLSPTVNLSASILDLGYIRWKNNLNQLNFNNDYAFQGVKFTYSDEEVDFGSELNDTLKNMFKFTNEHSAYTTFLNPKMYLAANYQPLKAIGFGALTRLELKDKRIDPQFTGSFLFTPFNWFNLALSYTIADKVYDNFGFGWVIKPGPFQFYTMFERIPSIYNKDKSNLYVPVYAKSFNVHFGINLVFGYNRDKKLLKDKPLVEE